MKIFVAQINQTIGDLEGNLQNVLKALTRAREVKADIALFPELTLSGYPPEDLLLDARFIDALEGELEAIRPATKGLFAAIGLPRWNPSRREKPLYNSAALFADGELLGFHDKALLPTYDVFDEKRFFEPGSEVRLWKYKGLSIAVSICEDIWQYAGQIGYTKYRFDPVLALKEKKPDLLLNLSSSPYSFQHEKERIFTFQKAAKALQCPVVLCNQVGAHDQLIFDGHSFFLNQKGELMQIAKGFVEDALLIDLQKEGAPRPIPKGGIGDLYAALVLGVRDYFHKQRFQKAIFGLSGGIDSALVACIAADALGPSQLLALNLPSRFSSLESKKDAAQIAKNLKIPFRTLDIDPLFQGFLNLLEPHFAHRPFDSTEENLQTRIRAIVLMAFSNKMGFLLLNTGNKSELAVGYTTLYGDLCGALGVLLDVTKEYVYRLARYVNERGPILPETLFTRPPSAELRPHQTDQDTLPPYEVLDRVIENYIEKRLAPEEIAKSQNIALDLVHELIRKIHLAEYKRRQAPIGLRVTSKCFSKGRNVPIVQRWHASSY